MHVFGEREGGRGAGRALSRDGQAGVEGRAGGEVELLPPDERRASTREREVLLKVWPARIMMHSLRLASWMARACDHGGGR
eukprot:1550436-Rhodomonas_salina.2